MKTIEYFKLQAKNLHKDFKTQQPYFDSSLGGNFFEYTPKFYDVDALVTDFDVDESKFSLMNAQHIIARLAGFVKWTELDRASPPALELAKLLFDFMHKITNEEWNYYVLHVENQNHITLDDEEKLDMFKTVFADIEDRQSYGYDYRLSKKEKATVTHEETKPMGIKSAIQITSLPLAGKDHEKFIKTANEVFENALQRIEHEDPEPVRKLWNPDQYIDEVLTPDKLPIDRNYALSLIEAFIPHKIIDLASEVDNQDLNLN
jgi:hypothetical protein